jgi:hypothetical protein
MDTDPQYMKKTKKSESGSILNGYGSAIHGKLKNPDLDSY